MTVNNGDVVGVDIIGDFNGTVETVQSYQFQLDGGGPLADADAVDSLVDIFEDIWAIIKLFMNTVTIVRRLKARIVPGGDLLGDFVWSPPLVGVTVSDVASTTVTAPLSFLTTTPRVILRKSFGPLLENGITTDGEISPPTLANLTSVSALLLSSRVEAFGTWIYGYYSPKVLGFVAPVSAVFSSAPGTMSRRRLGRGS